MAALDFDFDVEDWELQEKIAAHQEYLESLEGTGLHPHNSNWWMRFQYDRYDWEGFEPDYGVIRLTQGFFMIVNKGSLNRFAIHKWCADVRRDKETGEIVDVYAVRGVGPKKKARKLYAHRSAVKAAPSEIVDHVNHYGLDNRTKNLTIASKSENGSNYTNRRKKKVYEGVGSLPRGVYEVKVKGKRMGFKGRISVLGKAFHSRLCKTPGEAHKWYAKKHAELFPKRNKGWLKKERSEPVFPPLKIVDVFAPAGTTSWDIPF